MPNVQRARKRGAPSKGFANRKRTRYVVGKPPRCGCGRLRSVCANANGRTVKMGTICRCGDVRC